MSERGRWIADHHRDVPVVPGDHHLDRSVFTEEFEGVCSGAVTIDDPGPTGSWHDRGFEYDPDTIARLFDAALFEMRL